MENLETLADNYCDFLISRGFKLKKSTNIHSVEYERDFFGITITFDIVGYEMLCYFYKQKSNENVSLQDVLIYENIEDYNGWYQVDNLENMDKAMIYLAKVINFVMDKIDVCNETNFEKVYKFIIEKRNVLLDQCYIDLDLNKAEKYWAEKNYSLAKDLYQKHFDKLSKIQIKRLEYKRK